MEPFFIRTFWITLIMLWVALIILYFILTGRKSLERKGHHERYIEYLRRSHLVRICIIAVVLPLLILLAAWIVYRFSGPLTQEVQLAYIVVALVLLVIPFKFLDERINQKRIRELALETHEKIAVDLNYKTLHLIFNPIWEAILGPLALLYGIFFLRIEQWIIYLFLLIPWFMYLNIRGTRYQTRPYLRDNYTYMFAFNIFNFLFFLLYFCAYYLIRLKGAVELHTPGPSNVPFWESLPMLLLYLSGALIILGLMGRVTIYLAQYRTFIRTIDGAERTTPSPGRRLVFFITGLAVVLMLSGFAWMSRMIRARRIEVGVVQEKYLLHEYRGGCDTILVAGDALDDPPAVFALQDHPGTLRMSCRVRMSTTGSEKAFGICCPSLFDEIPVGEIIKFEYETGPTITGLLEH